MTPESATLLFNAIYGLGIVGWLALWFLARGHAAMRENRFLWIPFLYCIFVFLVQLLLWNGRVQAVDFAIEQDLIQVVEGNSQKLIQAILGSLIIAPILVSLRQGGTIARGFLVFQSLALIFVVVGVLPIYWIPVEQTDWLFVLRHVKTIPYTYCICCFLAGILILLHDLTTPGVDAQRDLVRWARDVQAERER